MSARVIVVTVLGREGDVHTMAKEDIAWFEKPLTLAVSVSRVGPLLGRPKVEGKGVKSWIQPVDGGDVLYVSENFEAICEALEAVRPGQSSAGER